MYFLFTLRVRQRERESERAAMHDLNILTIRPSGQGQCNCLAGGQREESVGRGGIEGAWSPRNMLLMCAILFATKPTHGTIKKP